MIRASRIDIASLAKIAEQLGGDVAGGGVLCPGPDHSADDRSLSVKPDRADREGFVTHSFAGDDWRSCRDHVRKLLGLAEPKAKPKEKKQKKTGDGKPWTTLGTYIYRDADNKPFLRVEKKLDDKGKRRFVQSYWNGSGWVTGAPKGPKIPYRLPELKAASETTVIHFCEGEKDSDTLAKIGFIATTMSEGSSAEWDKAATKHFKDRHVVILPDADVPGRKHGLKVATAIHGVAASVRVVDLYPDRHDGSDVSDWITNDTAGVKLAKLVKEADEWEPTGPATSEPSEPEEEQSEIDIEIARLARLPVIKYEQERKTAAEALGVRASVLDRLVQDERARLGGDDDTGLQGRAISLAEPEPWPEPVDGAALLDDISKAIGAHVIMPDASRDACALWAAHTFLLDCTMISPRLAITSPTRGCGKTTALDVMSQLVLRPLPSANVSASAIFRVVEGFRPTLMIDEADTFLRDNDELRGVLNSGHRKGGSVLRNVGDDHEVRSFSTFGACAIALIGQLPGTLADRSVPITLTRRKKDETIKPFRLDRVGHLVVLARRLARWTADHAVEIAATEPTMPTGIYNRAADNWRPLLAIATVAGGKWLERGQAAALASAAADIDDAALLELLLGDIRDIFAKRAANEIDPADRIPSAALAEALAEIEGRPWAEYGKNDKPLTQNKLARLLKPLKIVPENIRIDDKVPKGYILERFEEAFSRYLDPEGSSEPLHRYNPFKSSTSELFQSATAETDVADRKYEKPYNSRPCSGVADRRGGGRRRGRSLRLLRSCRWQRGSLQRRPDGPAP
ncbi:DUF3631 domain-containing protein [Bradyrhizobium sp. 63_E2_N1_3]|uniref:DUF3631 domain-containing protein n=1 Tax=Bradyrhizobium sp. 63_E2_N1_3 TaxID=3240373 RepID=UPI003F8B08C2